MSDWCTLRPPPRPLPRRLAFLMGLPTGLIAGLGALLLLLPLLMGPLMFPLGPLQEDAALSAEGVTAPGELLAISPTPSRHNGRRVQAHRYRFEHQGERYEGVSYETVKRGRPGTAVEVALLPSDPEVHRLLGARRARFPARNLTGFMMLPLVGSLMLEWGLLQGRTRLRLLREGHLFEAKVRGSQETLAKVDDRRVWRLTFSYGPDGGRRHTYYTNTPGIFTVEPTTPLLEHDGDALPAAAYPELLALDAEGRWATPSDAVWRGQLLVPIGMTALFTFGCLRWLLT